MKNIFITLALVVLCGTIVKAQSIVEYSFRVEGLCGMCSERIEKTAIKQGGAETAEFDLNTNILTVTIDHDKVQISGVRWEIAQAGHDNGDFKAPDDVYNDLPLCCQHRDSGNAEAHVNMVNDEDGEHIHSIDGYIYGEEEDGTRTPLIGATVSLIDHADMGTTTDINGYFMLDNSTAHSSGIEISYIGYETREVPIDKAELYEITLLSGHQLETVEISYRQRTTEISFVKTLNTEKITREELCKAACCNLSESFETNPSVDVSYSDAVTGAKQIQMLGLAGPYVQIDRELIPDVRAMSSVYGLSMTPGPWIESIQLIKGVGSVVNGYESITGQINVELKKPEKGELLFLNGFANNGGRLELNANGRRQLTESLSTSVLVHGKRMQAAHDRNGDGFTDMPLENDFVLASRWRYKNPNSNVMGQVGVKVSNLQHEGGYHDHFSGEDVDHENHWRMMMATRRYEAWAKIGYIDQENPETSIALQLSAVKHDQESSFGFEAFNVTQHFFKANLIYQYIPNDNNIVRAGLSYQLDDIYEFVQKIGVYDRWESVPGAFAEYTFKGENFALIPGVRTDYHNNYGLIVTPRLHAKYNFSDESVVRIVGGKGWRTASIFAENLGLFSTNRIVDITQSVDNTIQPYGLDAEVAWNYGISWTQGININDKNVILSLDAYRTDFENQIVVDYETAGQVSFYNLDGKSYSKSIQAKLEIPVTDKLDIRTAYRLFDVKTEYALTGLQQKPMVARHRAFINGAYKTDSNWHFDATLNWNGQKRLPDTSTNPLAYQRAAESPDFFILNAQIMKRWENKWDVYLGAENITNYKQTDAIIAADDTDSPFFDASIVWAPLFGTNIYVGFRMIIGAE